MNSKKTIWLIVGLILLGGVIYVYPTLTSKKKNLLFKDIVSEYNMNQKVTIGTSFQFTLNKDGLKSQDSVVLTLDGVRYEKIDEKYDITIPTQDLALGYHKVNVSAYQKDKNKTIELIFYVVSDVTPEMINHAIVQTLNRDTESYTQGLEMYNGALYESGGQLGQSLIRKVDPKSAKVIKKVNLPGDYFGEGLTIMDDKVYQLTWQNGVCLVYDLELNLLNKINFKSSNGEGWGICNDGKSLIISDGTNRLIYAHPETFEIEKVVSVYAGDREVTLLNELEYVNGYIYANIYTTDQIVKIEASSGKAVAVANLPGLDKANTKGDVFNGIAWDALSQSFIVTGKNWGKLYHVKM